MSICFDYVGSQDAAVYEERCGAVCKTRAFRCKMLTSMEPEFAGLPTFDSFSDENASQVGTNPCFGSKDLPANSGPIDVSIFSSSCYGFANSTAPLLVHSGWVLVVYKFCVDSSFDTR